MSPNATAFRTRSTGSAKKMIAQVPPSNSIDLMGSKVGSVKERGTIAALVDAHGVTMLRLRAQKTKDEL
ncbi:Alpha-galactosidase/alpha-n-acetylgalactosaminidase [Penicillium antarcticum]|uniref:Alpha-galactosidase/alpha-n- acetylgalactosaminidase n=1 Tax=Penicillium antarcticum TaxID=416450 RepID=UPI00239E7110|nr:Alpha-galactosidase/alpha-n-acetylgalactosaminidase [Penicillium antarcticum]KAJ5293706.1 Alpha-galactosidase/alpha-n-acetylgalactosaminidase [Penicillium antarcticum]